MLEKFRGTNEAEPRKQCESLARARVAFSMFLATLDGETIGIKKSQNFIRRTWI